MTSYEDIEKNAKELSEKIWGSASDDDDDEEPDEEEGDEEGSEE
jgi:hypothetical protein